MPGREHMVDAQRTNSSFWKDYRRTVSWIMVIFVVALSAGTVLGAQGSMARLSAASSTLAVQAASAPSTRVSVASPGDPFALITTITVGSTPAATAYDSARGEVYVANEFSNNVSVIRDLTGLIVASVSVGAYPSALAVDSGKHEVFVASDAVNVIADSNHTIVANITDNNGPVGLAYDSGKGEIFVADILTNSVSVISDATNAVVATVNVGRAPMALTYDAATGEVYVANFNDNTVSIISDATNAVMTTEAVGLAPSALAYDPAQGEVFVANFNSSTVSVISASTHRVTATISVGSHPLGIAYGAAASALLVTNSRAANASIIADSNNTVVASVNLIYGGSPFGVSYDDSNRGWYIADTLGTTEIVAQGYAIAFTETGLPTSTQWYQWVNGTSPFGAIRTETAATVATSRVIVPNGSYAFAVAAHIAGYQATPASGSVTVAGAALSRTITFSKLYTVTFTETGLPSGTTWSITISGTTKSVATTTITFPEINGTYTFTVNAVTGYVSAPASGNVTVAGADASQAISFTVAPPGPSGAGLGDVAIYAIVGVVVVIAAIAAILVLRRRGRKLPPSQGEPPAGGPAP